MADDRLPILLLLSLGLAPLLGCSDYGYTSATNKDVFQQVRRNTVDVLMVVDNSCSMAEEQDKLADNFQSFIAAFEGADVDWQIGVVSTDTVDPEHSGRLLGGADEIVIRSAGGATLDEVRYNEDWDIQPGVALQLDPGKMKPTSNDTTSAWCSATSAYGDGDLGTPGDENASCGAKGSKATDSGDTGDTGGSDDGGADDGDARAPKSGDLVISEFMADAGAVSDTLGEWVEITNIALEAIDLTGCTLGDADRNSWPFPDGTTLGTGERLVVGRTTDTSQNGGAAVDLAAEDGFTLNNNVLVLTPGVDSVHEIFGEMVALGTSGSGIEMGLEGARMALTPEMLAGRNAGFLRDDANLSLVFLSDENDYSPLSVNEYLRTFKDLKGDEAYRDNGIVNISAVVGKDVPAYDGLFSCESDDGLAAYGVRYVDLASRTEGALESICDSDFSPIAYELGLVISGLLLEFALSDHPDVSTLKVSLYADQTEDSFLKELVKDVDYSYDAEKNVIRFEAEQVPTSETWIVVEYRVLATGASSARSTP